MKHVLLGSTALVAAGLLGAGTASAAEPVSLGITGFYQAAIGGLIDQDDDDGESGAQTRDHSVETNGEIRFHGETTLDNGLTVGARIELEAFNSSDQIDQAYAFLSGGFGEVRLGDTLEALSQMCYITPGASSLFGADSPNINFSNAGVNGYGATNGTCYGLAAESSSIIYFSPNFGGFSFGVSYAPEASDSQGGGVANIRGGAGTTFTNNNGQIGNIYSGAVSFAHDFNGFSLAVGGGVSVGDREEAPGQNPALNNAEDSVEDYQAYLQVGFGGWTVGGAFERTDGFNGAAAKDSDRTVYGVGATYGWDAWTVGLAWTHGDYDFGNGMVDDDHDIIQFTGAYALGPGISLEGMVGYVDYDGDNANADYEAVEIGTGIGINF